MDTLPAEHLAHIFSFLPPEDVARGKQLNKHIRDSLTLYRRRLQRPVAPRVNLYFSYSRRTNELSAEVSVTCALHRFMGPFQYFHCTRTELQVSKKFAALYTHFKEWQDCGDYVRQPVGSLAESLDIALQWVISEMFLEELKIGLTGMGKHGSDTAYLTPEIMDVVLKVGRQVAEEEPYAQLFLELEEDLLPMHVALINKFNDWKVRVLATRCPLDLLGHVTVPFLKTEQKTYEIAPRSDLCMEMLLNRLRHGGEDIIQYEIDCGNTDAVAEVLKRWSLPLIEDRIVPYHELTSNGQTHRIYVDNGTVRVTNTARLNTLMGWGYSRSQQYLARSVRQ